MQQNEWLINYYFFGSLAPKEVAQVDLHFFLIRPHTPTRYDLTAAAMEVRKFLLREVQTRTQLAEKLGVDVSALELGPWMRRR